MPLHFFNSLLLNTRENFNLCLIKVYFQSCHINSKVQKPMFLIFAQGNFGMLIKVHIKWSHSINGTLCYKNPAHKFVADEVPLY